MLTACRLKVMKPMLIKTLDIKARDELRWIASSRLFIGNHNAETCDLFSDCYLQGVKRTSHLQAPIMLLSGHDGDIFCTKFAPSGQFLASAGFDRLICALLFDFFLLHCF